MITKSQAKTTNPSSPTLTAHDAGRVYAFRGLTLPAGASRECRAGYAEAERELMEPAARLLGRKGGKARAAASTEEQRQEWARKGADATNAATTPEQRSERARKAAAARWDKRK